MLRKAITLALSIFTITVMAEDQFVSTEPLVIDSLVADSIGLARPDTIIQSATSDVKTAKMRVKQVHDWQLIPSIYDAPYSFTGRQPNWHKMWMNTALLNTAFVGTLLVLECLPEDATSWNRAELRNQPLFDRWWKHVIKKGPEWDHDKFYFNYLLHPYAGAAYFMGARSCGFNFWQSLLYSACISSIGWEFGIEAFMERPSYQDLVVTPVVGSLIGEGFYRAKRSIRSNDYRLLGSKFLGHFVAFFCDPVNEFVEAIAGQSYKGVKVPNKIEITSTPLRDIGGGKMGFSLTCTF